MKRSLRAIYENGVLRPLEPLDLPEYQHVALVVSELPAMQPDDEWLDVECLQLYAGEADDSISLEVVRKALSKIPGSLTEDFIAERDER